MNIRQGSLFTIFTKQNGFFTELKYLIGKIKQIFNNNLEQLQKNLMGRLKQFNERPSDTTNLSNKKIIIQIGTYAKKLYATKHKKYLTNF